MLDPARGSGAVSAGRRISFLQHAMIPEFRQGMWRYLHYVLASHTQKCGVDSGPAHDFGPIERSDEKLYSEMSGRGPWLIRHSKYLLSSSCQPSIKLCARITKIIICILPPRRVFQQLTTDLCPVVSTLF